MKVLLLDVVNDNHVEVLVPATVQQEAELVHLQEVARRRLIVCS